MRRLAAGVLLVTVVLCLSATGGNREIAKIYVTVGPYGGTDGGTQLWRCNIDGTEPELLLETTELGDVDVDSVGGVLYYNRGYYVYAADLDGSNPYVTALSAFPQNLGYGLWPFDSEAGYFCHADDAAAIETHPPDGSTQRAAFGHFDGVVSNPVSVGVALYLSSESGMEEPRHMSWGSIKSSFR